MVANCADYNGLAGGDIHVDWVLEIAREIVAEHHLTLRTAVIYAEQDKAYLKRLLHQNRILPLDDRGPVYRFNLNHVAVPSTAVEMFRTHFIDLCP